MMVMASTYCLTGAFTMVLFYDTNLPIAFDAICITGLSNLEKLVEKWTEAPSTYSPTEMRACLDTFREVLFHHFDEEVGGLMHSELILSANWLSINLKVADLRGENLVKYMTLADLEKIPIS